MKKTLYTLFAITTFGLFAATAYAASGDYTQDAQGAISIDNTNLIAAGQVVAPLVFNASSNVIVDGVSSATSFAHSSYHGQVEDKENGRQFGMSADKNVIVWLNVSTDSNGKAPIAGFTGTTSAIFPVADWNTL